MATRYNATWLERETYVDDAAHVDLDTFGPATVAHAAAACQKSGLCTEECGQQISRSLREVS
jgi:hypothetical protein